MNTPDNADAAAEVSSPAEAIMPGLVADVPSETAASGRRKRGASTGKAEEAGAAKPARTKPARTRKAAETKADMVLKKLRSAKGASIPQLCEATGWQAHSVRGFLSGTVKKKLGFSLTSEVSKDGVRRYRIGSGCASGNSDLAAAGEASA